MSKDSLTLSYKQIGAIALIVINVLIVAPGGWILKTLSTEARTFKSETENEIQSLKDDISAVRIEISSGFVSRRAFTDYKEQVAENIRHLDSKVAGMKE